LFDQWRAYADARDAVKLTHRASALRGEEGWLGRPARRRHAFVDAAGGDSRDSGPQ
jgi:hypothetical protein